MRALAAIAGPGPIPGLMAACLGPVAPGEGAITPADDPLPPEVARIIPAGVARSDVLVLIDSNGIGGCYYYRQPNAIVPLSTPELRAAGFGPDQPFCVG